MYVYFLHYFARCALMNIDYNPPHTLLSVRFLYRWDHQNDGNAVNLQALNMAQCGTGKCVCGLMNSYASRAVCLTRRTSVRNQLTFRNKNGNSKAFLFRVGALALTTSRAAGTRLVHRLHQLV